MKKYILMLGLLCCGFSWQTVLVDGGGKPTAHGRNQGSLPDRPLKENEYPADYVLPDVEYKFWKKVGNDWVTMTPAEQQAVIDAENTVEAEYANWTKRERALCRLFVKEINKLRVKTGDVPYTVEQVKAALKAEME